MSRRSLTVILAVAATAVFAVGIALGLIVNLRTTQTNPPIGPATGVTAPPEGISLGHGIVFKQPYLYSETPQPTSPHRSYADVNALTLVPPAGFRETQRDNTSNQRQFFSDDGKATIVVAVVPLDPEIGFDQYVKATLKPDPPVTVDTSSRMSIASHPALRVQLSGLVEGARLGTLYWIDAFASPRSLLSVTLFYSQPNADVLKQFDSWVATLSL